MQHPLSWRWKVAAAHAHGIARSRRPIYPTVGSGLKPGELPFNIRAPPWDEQPPLSAIVSYMSHSSNFPRLASRRRKVTLRTTVPVGGGCHKDSCLRKVLTKSKSKELAARHCHFQLSWPSQRMHSAKRTHRRTCVNLVCILLRCKEGSVASLRASCTPSFKLMLPYLSASPSFQASSPCRSSLGHLGAEAKAECIHSP